MVELNARETRPSLATDTTAPGSAGGFVPRGGDGKLGTVQFPDAYPRQSRGLTELSAILDACVPYLPWVWVVGTPLTFVLLATGVVGAERLRRSSRAIHDGPIAEACRRLSQSLGVTRRVPVAVCGRIAAPVLVGMRVGVGQEIVAQPVAVGRNDVSHALPPYGRARQSPVSLLPPSAR